MSFSHLGLSEALVTAASRHVSPTPVQSATIPAVLAGGDVLAQAWTGSGKTTAYVLPLLQRWVESSKKTPRQVQTLILVPTRELAAQVREVIQEYAMHLPERIKVISVVGGISINPQMMALRGGTDFLVATPGRLLDLVHQNAITLSETQTLVLDEADRILDLGFADELTRILSLLPRRRQNLLFSATFPKAVEAMAAQLLCEPTRFEMAADPVDAPAIVQRAIRVDKDKRTPLLRHLITTEGWKRVLVFVASQYTADHVAEKLCRQGIAARAFHGGLSQGARGDVLADFKSSGIQVLVSTDLAARGLDIAQLPVVLNYDLPRSATVYTHRIGRTGRAGIDGSALTLITEDTHSNFRVIEKHLQRTFLLEEIEGFEPKLAVKNQEVGSGGIKGRRKSKKDKLREATKQTSPPRKPKAH